MSRPKPSLSVSLLVGLFASLALIACGDNTATPVPAPATTTVSSAGTPSGRAAATSGTIKIRLTHVTGANSTFGKFALKFKELAEARTNNRVAIEIYPDVSLAGGNNQAAFEQVQAGAVEASIHSSLIYSNFDVKFQVFSLPYIISNHENAYRVIDSAVGKELMDGMDKLNVVGLAYGENGFRQLTNSKKPVSKPDDLKGLKIRIPEAPLYRSTMKVLGAEPIVITFNEVYNALQIKTIDGQENPLSIIADTKLNEVQKYLTIWNYSWDTAILGFNKKFWGGLPTEVQTSLRAAAQEAALYDRGLIQDGDKTLAEDLKKKGMEITTLTDDQRKAFIDATRSIYTESEPKIGKDLIEKVQKIGQGG